MNVFQPRSLQNVCMLFVMIASANHTAKAIVDSPDTIPGTVKVTAEEVLDLAESKPDLVIIDARISMDRKQGYIEGSVSLPDVDTNCKTLAKQIPSKTTNVLFYCNGVKCGRSVTSSRLAVKCGYKNIYWYRGGFEDWKSKNLPTIKD